MAPAKNAPTSPIPSATIGARIRDAVKRGKDLPSLVGEHAAIIAEFEGQTCQCGRRKTCGVAFCPKCIQALPTPVYTRVWQSRGDELDAAYAIALGMLHEPLIAERAKRRDARG